jgi:hypothetical protein
MLKCIELDSESTIGMWVQWFIKMLMHGSSRRSIVLGAAFLTQSLTLEDSTQIKFEIWDTVRDQLSDHILLPY